MGPLLRQGALGLAGGILVLLSCLLGTGHVPWGRPYAALPCTDVIELSLAAPGVTAPNTGQPSFAYGRQTIEAIAASLP